MKLVSTFCIICIFASCKNNFESKVKSYMKDSVVQHFNDPSSYQYISMQIDTFRGKNYIENVLSLSSYAEKKDSLRSQIIADSLTKIPGYLDSVLNYQITVNLRAKNKLGTLVIGKTSLYYYPQEDRFEQKGQMD